MKDEKSVIKNTDEVACNRSSVLQDKSSLGHVIHLGFCYLHNCLAVFLSVLSAACFL